VSSIVIRVARPPVSLRVSPRGLVVVAALLTACALLAVAALSIGSTDVMDPARLVAALFGDPEAVDAFAVRELRLPRVLAGLVVGVALGMSGAMFQGVTRNGLVAPDIIGVTTGASLAALIVIVLGTQVRGQGDSFEVPLSAIGPAALVGAFGAAFLVYLLAWKKGLSPYRLVLVGIGVTAVLAALIAYALTLTRFPFATQLAFRWTVGSMYGTDWTEVGPALVVFALLVLVTLFLLRPLPALALGDDAATGLGSRVESDRLRLLAVGTCLAALSVALAGPVAFVAFMAPHLARGLLRAPGIAVVAVAGLAGAALIMGADLVALRILPGTELPLGAVTALIGAPYFLFLLYRTNRSGVAG
jgi:iron complex transport system permease protein